MTKGTRRRRAAAAWLVAISLLGGCAGTQRSTTVAEGAVHTIRQSYNNTHVLTGPIGSVIVDAGMESDADALVERLERLGIAGETVRAVIITHGHADHAGGATRLGAYTDAPLIAGAGDRELLATGRNDRLCPTDDRARRDLDKHQRARFTPYEADLWVEDTLDLAPITGLDAEIVALPGHTDGSLVIVADDAAFVGDLFRGAIFGPGAETHFYMCDLRDNLNDVEWLLERYPDVETYFTGHFGPVSRDAVVRYIDRVASRA